VTARRGGRLVRTLIAIALTAVVLWQADPAAVLRATARTDLAWIGLAVGLVVIDRALMAYRWTVLVRVLEPPERLPLASILRVFFLSTFTGTLLPTSVGTDAIRAYGLTRARASGATSIASVLMDRFLGVLSLLIVTVAGLPLAGDLLRQTSIIIAIVVTVTACALGFGAVYSEGFAPTAARLWARVPAAPGRRTVDELAEALRTYARHHAAVVNVLAGSITVQILRIAQAYALGRALGLALPLTPYFAFLPIILLVMLLPISINGLGTSQVAFVALFGRAGVAAEQAVALSLLFLALGVLGNVPGALLYATSDGRRRQEPHG
jgi:hypothetical protein